MVLTFTASSENIMTLIALLLKLVVSALLVSCSERKRKPQSNSLDSIPKSLLQVDQPHKTLSCI